MSVRACFLPTGQVCLVPIPEPASVAALRAAVHAGLELPLPLGGYTVTAVGADGAETALEDAWEGGLEEAGIVGAEERVDVDVTARVLLQMEGMDGAEAERVVRAALSAAAAGELLEAERARVATVLAAGMASAASVDRLFKDALRTALAHPAVDRLRAVLSVAASGGVDAANVRLSATGAAALHIVAKAGRADALDLLLAAGASVDCRAREGTALHYAAWQGHAAVVRALLAHGASAAAANRAGQRPLHLASEHGAAACVAALLDYGARTDARDHTNQTALHLAAQRGHVDVVRLLLDQGAAADVPDETGATPMHHAARWGQARAAAALAAHCPIGVDARDDAGATALLCAATHGHRNVVRALLAAGATADGLGQTPQGAAGRSSHVDAARLLNERRRSEAAAFSASWPRVALRPHEYRMRQSVPMPWRFWWVGQGPCRL